MRKKRRKEEVGERRGEEGEDEKTRWGNEEGERRRKRMDKVGKEGY